MADQDFDPTAYLARKKQAVGFDPTAYLESKKVGNPEDWRPTPQQQADMQSAASANDATVAAEKARPVGINDATTFGPAMEKFGEAKKAINEAPRVGLFGFHDPTPGILPAMVGVTRAALAPIMVADKFVREGFSDAGNLIGGTRGADIGGQVGAGVSGAAMAVPAVVGGAVDLAGKGVAKATSVLPESVQNLGMSPEEAQRQSKNLDELNKLLAITAFSGPVHEAASEAGMGAAKSVQSGLYKTADVLERHAQRPLFNSEKGLEQFDRQAATTLSENLAPSRSGVQKTSNLLQRLDDASQSRISQATKAGVTVDFQGLRQKVGEIVSGWKSSVQLGDAVKAGQELDAAISQVSDQHPDGEVPFKEAWKFKQSLQDMVGKYYDRDSPIKNNIAKQLGHSLLDDMVSKVPELRDIGMHQRDLIEAQSMQQRRLAQLEKRSPGFRGFKAASATGAGLLAGGPTGAVAALGTELAADSPSFQHKMAVIIDRLAGKRSADYSDYSPVPLPGRNAPPVPPAPTSPLVPAPGTLLLPASPASGPFVPPASGYRSPQQPINMPAQPGVTPQTPGAEMNVSNVTHGLPNERLLLSGPGGNGVKSLPAQYPDETASNTTVTQGQPARVEPSLLTASKSNGAVIVPEKVAEQLRSMDRPDLATRYLKGDRLSSVEQEIIHKLEDRVAETPAPVTQPGGAGAAPATRFPDQAGQEAVKPTDVFSARALRTAEERTQSEQQAKTKIKSPDENTSLGSANSYNRSAGLPEVKPHEFKPSDPVLQKSISDAYSHLQDVTRPDYVETPQERDIFESYKKKMPDVLTQHGISNYKQLVEKSYGQLIKEVDAQFKSAPTTFEFHGGDQNYANSAEMLDDVHNFNHLSVYRGGEDHSMLGSKTIDENGLTANDKFRAVHDLYGHSVEGYQFGKDGQENAWIEHSKMFSPLAQLALSSETRGQNSYVNFSGVNDGALDMIKEGGALKKAGKVAEGQALIDQASKDFKFADQKSVVLPPEMTDAEKFMAKEKLKPDAPAEPVAPQTITSKNLGDIDQRIKQASGDVKTVADLTRVKKVASAITKHIPDAKVVLHDDTRTFDSAAKNAGVDTPARGLFMDGNEIHVNMEKANATTALHEGVHALVGYALDNSSDLMNSFHSQLSKILDKETRGSLDKFASGYEDKATQKSEFVTEFFARVADGQIDLKKMNVGVVSRIRSALRGTAEKLGLDPNRIGLSSDKNVIDFARKLDGVFNGGDLLRKREQRTGIKTENVQAQTRIGDARLMGTIPTSSRNKQ